MFVRFLCTLVLALLFTPFARAQDAAGADETGANVRYEGGIHVGKLLPNQMPGLTEITGMGGVRGGYRLGNMVFGEGGFSMGKGHGAEIQNLALSIRMDVPVENIVGTMFIGPTLLYYKGEHSRAKFYGSAHVGGGVMALIGGNVWFRSDMTFTVNPGTSLYIGFGFVFRLPDGGGA
jgi:hypothetical protein